MKKGIIEVQYSNVQRKKRVKLAWTNKEAFMGQQPEEYGKLFEEQVSRLQECHFLVLYWSAQSEGKSKKYNITNLFDDLKHACVTRTKQTAVSAVLALSSLCFIDLREEHNRKNIYITRFGARALESMVLKEMYKPRSSSFLEEK